MLSPNYWNEGLGLINKLLQYWLWVSLAHDSFHSYNIRSPQNSARAKCTRPGARKAHPAHRVTLVSRVRAFFQLSCVALTEIREYMQSEVWKNILKRQQFYLIIDIRWMISCTTIRCLCFAARIWDNVVLSLATLYPLPSGVVPASSPCITAALVLKVKKTLKDVRDANNRSKLCH